LFFKFELGAFMNLFAKSIAVLSAVLLLSACDTNPNAGGSGDGSGNMSSGTGVGGFLDSDRNVSDRVLFELDSSQLDSEAQSVLQSQAAWLKQNPSVKLTIEGHCDERGTREYNIALGERRASAAKKFLVGLGVASNRLSTISYGKERPAVVGSDESSWSQNRRAVSVATN
jgi:peptidoglycan-associated lipoprotein